MNQTTVLGLGALGIGAILLLGKKASAAIAEPMVPSPPAGGGGGGGGGLSSVPAGAGGAGGMSISAVRKKYLPAGYQQFGGTVTEEMTQYAKIALTNPIGFFLPFVTSQGQVMGALVEPHTGVAKGVTLFIMPAAKVSTPAAKSKAESHVPSGYTAYLGPETSEMASYKKAVMAGPVGMFMPFVTSDGSAMGVSHDKRFDGSEYAQVWVFGG